MLQCVAWQGSVMQCVQCVAVRYCGNIDRNCAILQCVAVCYSVVQCVAVHYSGNIDRSCTLLQCTAVCCSILQWTEAGKEGVGQ